MARYVDRLIDYTGRVPYRHKVWCHLVADTDEELRAAAADLGLPDALLQGVRGWDTHLDLPAPLRPDAVAAGAVEVDFRFMGRRTRARRAALALGVDVAVGAPSGTAIEVPLPPPPVLPASTRRSASAAAPALVLVEDPQGSQVVTRTREGRLFPGRPVLVLTPPADAVDGYRAVVAVGDLRIGAVWAPAARQDRR